MDEQYLAVSAAVNEKQMITKYWKVKVLMASVSMQHINHQ